MPIFDTIKTLDFSLIVWQISETDIFFIPQLQNKNIDLKAILEVKNDSMRLQKLASRYALCTLLENEHIAPDFGKDEFGKLHLIDKSVHISISHCAGFACAALSSKIIGVDLEPFSDKVEKVAHKFMHSTEIEQFTTISDKQFVWSSKEALYKAYGKKKLIFKDNMRILNANQAQLLLPDQTYHFTLFRKQYPTGLILVCGVEG